MKRFCMVLALSTSLFLVSAVVLWANGDLTGDFNQISSDEEPLDLESEFLGDDPRITDTVEDTDIVEDTDDRVPVPLDSELYREAQVYKEQALQKLEQGQYRESIDLSERSAALSIQARLEAAERYAAFRAHAFRRRAAEAIRVAARNRTTTAEQKALLADARAYYQDGLDLLEQEQYRVSTLAFQDTLAVLDIANIEVVVRSLIFPSEYRVRLIPEDRDSLSKISQYPFVYGDYRRWRVLYEANRELLKEPDNPDLIFPDQVFVIPSIEGEIREGRWDPESEYPSFKELAVEESIEEPFTETADETLDEADAHDPSNSSNGEIEPETGEAEPDTDTEIESSEAEE